MQYVFMLLNVCFQEKDDFALYSSHIPDVCTYPKNSLKMKRGRIALEQRVYYLVLDSQS